MTAFSTAGRLLPAALRPVVLENVPAGWERQAHRSSEDGDALTWLGFEPGEPDEPLLTWPEPVNWPTLGFRRWATRVASARARTA